MVRPQPSAQVGEGAIPYLPALDGLRALALTAVLLFHAGVAFPGGFLGVSTFFTLSGFLITTLLLERWRAPESRPVRAFWLRRARRLLPAAFAGLGLAVVITALCGTAGQREDLRGDTLATLADVENWHLLVAGQSYSELFEQPSAFQHYWSLSIEEQFYFVLPLVAAACLMRQPASARGNRHRDRDLYVLAAILALGLAGSLLSTALNAGHANRVYYGTDTRAAELLVGCVLALAVFSRGGLTPLVSCSRGAAVTASLAGLVALTTSIFLWQFTSRETEVLYQGGLPAISVVSGCLIIGAIVPGPTRALLSTPPMVWLGRVSYGVYVYHWPLFIAFDEQRTGLNGAALLTVRLAATLSVAVLSYFLLEQPVRQRAPALTQSARLPVVAVTAAATIALIASLVAAANPSRRIDYAASEHQFEAELHQLPAQRDLPAPVEAPEPPSPWITVMGDQHAAATAFGLSYHLNGRSDAHVAEGVTRRFCSALRGGLVRDVAGVHPNTADCENRNDVWRRQLEATHPDVVIVQLGTQDLHEHDLDRDGTWRAIGDATFDERLLSELTDLLALATSTGAAVIAIDLPTDWSVLGVERPWMLDAATYQQRAQRFNALLRVAIASAPPSTVHPSVFDFDAWLASIGGPATFRPDGTTIAAHAADAFAAQLLANATIAHRGLWQRRWLEEHRVRTAASPGTSDVSPPRVLVAGDSTAVVLAVGLHSYAERTGNLAVASVARSNCGVLFGGERRDFDLESADRCPDWQPAYADALSRFDPDVVLLSSALWELTDWRRPGDTAWRHLGDPQYEQQLLAALQRAIDTLAANGATVALVKYPHLDLGRDRRSLRDAPFPAGEWWRMDRYHELLDSLASARPGVEIIDLASHAKSFDGGEMDAQMRPDGVHFSTEAADQVAEQFLGPALRQLVRPR